ncbi:hypothetical protein [Streptomyces pinistramenti]|nr:hypothetical protein [Streptomyces pinistramenti]MCB5910055.1 hypothetical protein [Streptomyces pinistramenti]
MIEQRIEGNRRLDRLRQQDLDERFPGLLGAVPAACRQTRGSAAVTAST